MPRFMSSRLVLMLIGSVFCAQPILFAGAAPDQQAYVVTVRPDASIDGIPVIAKQIAASYGGTVVEGAGGGGDTFVIRVAKSRARILSLDPHVKSVVPMGFTQAPQTVVETVPWSSGVSYSYDGTGNITQIGNDAFAYDGVSRLSQATVNGIARKYDYDAFGNRTACSQLGQNDCQGFLINAAENKNRLAGTGYDAAGNVTGLSGHVYSYDPLNMMTRDSFGQLSREFVYTADDERIATYTVGSSWNWTLRGTDGKVLREFTSNDGPAGPGTTSWQWTKDDIWRNGLLLASRQPDGANTTTYHYHLDHLGTARRVTDQNDRIVGVHDYLAFGPELSGSTAEPSATTLKYTGHERDSWSTGSPDDLDYMHARYYSAWLGRFSSVDPLRGQVDYPQSWNRYSYVRNNPIVYLDRTGLYPCTVTWGKSTFPSECVDVRPPWYERWIMAYEDWDNRRNQALIERDRIAVNYYRNEGWTWLAALAAHKDAAIMGVMMVGAVGGKAGGAPEGGFGDNVGGYANEAQILEAADQYLGPGYKEIAPGVYRSADGTRQFRMTDSDFAGKGMGGQPHVHFESVPPGGGPAFENTHVIIVPRGD